MSSLSVIIPTRNRAELLRSMLQALQKQTLPASDYEVLVIDNGSTDHTRDVVMSFTDAGGQLRYFFDATPGLHVGRHLGLREAACDVLVYADDDIEPVPMWLEAIRDCFRSADVAMVGGNNYPKFTHAPPAWLQKLWDRPAHGGHAITYLSVLELPEGRRMISPFLIWGCNFSIRRQVLIDAGGFHPDGMPEDRIRFRGDGETHVAAHVAKKGLACLFDSRASVYHTVTPERMTFGYFRKRAFSQGVSDSYTQLRNGSRARSGRAADPRVALRVAHSLLERVRAGITRLAPRDTELRELERIVKEGYEEGYAYHQRAYHDDPEVRAWVHKPDYF